MFNWIQKQKKIYSDWTSALTFIIVTILTIINIVASLFAPINDFFNKHNIYISFAWVVVFLILINLHKVLEYISKQNSCHSYECDDIFEIISPFKKYKKIKIFFGLDTFHLWEKIAEHRNLNINNLEVYFDPSSIKEYKKPKFKCKKLQVFFTDIPRNYLYISGNSNKCEESNLVIESNGQFSVIKIGKENDKNKEILNSLFEKLTETNKISIDENFKIQTLYFIIKKARQDKLDLIKSENINLPNREEFLSLSTELVKNAKESLYAIDFIGPQFWTNKNDKANEFGEAQKVKVVKEKRRIHIYNFEEFERNNSNLSSEDIYTLYKKYMKFMKDLGIDILFFDQKDFDVNKFEKRGTLIIDNQAVVIAINPTEGASFGLVSFKEEEIKKYKNRFDTIHKNAIMDNEFIKILEKRYKK